MCKIFLFKKDDNLKRNTRSPFKVWIGCWLKIGCHCFVHVFFRWGNFTEGSCQEPHEGVCHLWPPRLQQVSLFMYQAILETFKSHLNLKVIYRILKKNYLLSIAMEDETVHVLCESLLWTTLAFCLQTDSSSDCIDCQYCLFYIKVLW